MAQSVPEPASSPAARAGFAAEFERLAGRPPTEAEREIARRASSDPKEAGSAGRAIWAESFLPESLAYVAVALASGEGQRVLFVSPSADLLENRQLRLKSRAPTTALSELARHVDRTSGVTVWATPNQASGALLARAFGSGGPTLILIEDAHAILSESFAFRPSMAGLKEVIGRFKNARVVVASAARGEQLREKIGRTLGLPELSGTDGERVSVVEAVVRGSSSPLLRVVSDESEVLGAVIGPLPRPCLVLCSTPAQADQVYAHLEAEQVPVHRYHSGLPASDRARELVHFALPGRRAVMVAVSAYGPSSGFAGQTSESFPEEFGHGYARRDIRSLVHLCAPCSLDQYTRELALLGSGGKPPVSDPDTDEIGDDGALRESEESGSGAPKTVALMLYNPAHLALNLALLERKRPAKEALGVAIDGLLGAQKGQYRSLSSLDPKGCTSPRSLSLVVEFLKDLGVIEVRGGEARALVGVPELRAAKRTLEEAFESLSAGDGPRLEEVEKYALSTSCRVQTLQKLLGQTSPPGHAENAASDTDACGKCDVCAPQGLAEMMELRRVYGSPAPMIETLPTRRRSPARRGGERIQKDADSPDGDLLDGALIDGDLPSSEVAELDHDIDAFSA